MAASPPNLDQPPPAAWVDPYTLRRRRGLHRRLDAALDYANWVLHIGKAALRDPPAPAVTDAWLFAGAVFHRLGHLRETPQWLTVHRAASLGDTATAQAIEHAIRQLNRHGLLLPDHLREYVARRAETGADYTRRPRGGDPWRHAARDRALTRAAYDWRLTCYDWRQAHPDLAAPAACLHWTANRLTAGLDCIAEYFGAWWTAAPEGPQFFASDALCAAHGLPQGDDHHALLLRIYPQHFRGLLIGHLATLCLDEWTRRIADGPAPT